MRKNIIFLFMFVLLCILTACGSSGVDNSSTEKKADNSATVKKDKKIEEKDKTSDNTNANKKEDTELVTDGPLLEPGQYKTDEQYGSTITLLEIATPKTDISLGDLKMTIQDVKIFKHENISDTEKNDFSQSKIPITDPFYTIQLTYDLENNSDTALTTNGFEYIITDQQQQIEVSTEYIGGEPYYNVQSGAQLSPEYVTCILKPENVENINKVTLKTSEVYNSDTYDTTAESKTIEINLK
ncbi:TPA_asm: hypothetical protein GYS69_13170 [Listeria monocytogenes]|nr:hypothetical protein [Listeria monocytogenes]